MSTAGQTLAAEVRSMYRIGTRTRWGAKRPCRTLTRAAIIEDLRHAIGEFRGIESERRTAVLDAAFTALNAYGKFVDGYRIDGVLRWKITTSTPWQFAAFLGAPAPGRILAGGAVVRGPESEQESIPIGRHTARGGAMLVP
jgi:hypothetical protein